jgi:hypothetical protein
LPRLTAPQPMVTVHAAPKKSRHGPAAEVYAEPAVDPLLL